MKYIILKDSPYTDKEKMFIFPDTEMHSEFYNLIKQEYSVLISAGFVELDEDGFHCCGESISLRVGSRQVDTKILKWEMSKRH